MDKTKQNEQPKKTCFVIMPISDMDGYEEGHFSKVYNYLIKPAAEACDYAVDRADDTKGTNFIIVDILTKVYQADVVICDLSGQNANVLFELGLRQAFDKPVVLIKDDKTKKIFDIDGLRFREYTSSLVIDSALSDQKEIAQCIRETTSHDNGMNSLINLLSIKQSASIPQSESEQNINNYIIRSLETISRRLADLEMSRSTSVGTIDLDTITNTSNNKYNKYVKDILFNELINNEKNIIKYRTFNNTQKSINEDDDK